MTPLQQAAQAVIHRWDTTDWKNAKPTAGYIADMRMALEDEQAQAVEPVAYFLKDPSGHFHEVSTKACYPGSLPLFLRPQQAAVPSDERAELIAAHQELNMSNYGPDDVDELNDWANRAHDMLEADVSLINEGNKAQQAKQDKARLDWLEQNLFNRENLTLGGNVCKTQWMLVMFAPRGVQGSARTIIDAAMPKQAPTDWSAA